MCPYPTLVLGRPPETSNNGLKIRIPYERLGVGRSPEGEPLIGNACELWLSEGGILSPNQRRDFGRTNESGTLREASRMAAPKETPLPFRTPIEFPGEA